MNTWLFALVVLAFGLLLAIFVDRHKNAPGPPLLRKERMKWMYYWFLGRFPTDEENREAEEEEKREAQKKRK
jgi:uncharacterized membrane protein YdfJ with MMPL/SSD domain